MREHIPGDRIEFGTAARWGIYCSNCTRLLRSARTRYPSATRVPCEPIVVTPPRMSLRGLLAPYAVRTVSSRTRLAPYTRH